MDLTNFINHGVTIYKDRCSVTLTEENQKELIRHIWKENPGIIREIVCEECPEHIG